MLCQSPNKLHTHTRRKVKGQHGCHHHGHGNEGTALEPLCLWTSSIDEVLYIEQRLCAAKVGHVGQSWTEATEHSKFTQDKMDLQHRLSSATVLSRQHLEIYKDKLADARGLSNHRNKFQSWACWDDWVSCVTDGQTDTISSLYSRWWW